MTDEAKDTITVIDKTPPAPAEKAETTTREEAQKKGWSDKEIEAAEKRGVIAKPEPKKPEEKQEKKDEQPTDKKQEPINSSLPDFTITDPAKEKVFLDTFGSGTPQRAMYFRMKHERQARQKAEMERDRLKLEVQTFRDENGGRRGQETDQPQDEDDPEDKPLTIRQLKELQKAEREAWQKQKDEIESRAGRTSEALKTQEEFAKEVYPDFEETVKLAKNLVEDMASISDPVKRSKVLKLVSDLRHAAANADQYGVDEYNASMIAYELGQLHPEYGKKSATNGAPKGDPKDGDLTPEQMERIEKNTQRRASSASLPGGSNGHRTISINEVSVKDLLGMTPEQRRSFKKDHPERYAKLMRG